MVDGCHDLVFDLTFLRRYETFALVRLAREWDRLAEAGCAVHVAAREARVSPTSSGSPDEDGWELHPSTTRALRALRLAAVCAPAAALPRLRPRRRGSPRRGRLREPLRHLAVRLVDHLALEHRRAAACSRSPRS